jgi:hypothetical protein
MIEQTGLPFFRQEKRRLIPGLPVLGKALLAIDRSPLRRLERNFAIFTTV